MSRLRYVSGIIACLLCLCQCSVDKERKYNSNGQLSMEVELVDGKREGVMLVYYDDGSLLKEVPWSGGIRDGIERQYYKNGQIEIERIWINGRLEGQQKEYNDDGDLHSIVSWTDGKKRIVKFYDSTGLATEISTYNDKGRPVYIATYFEDGSLKSQLLPAMYEEENDTIHLGETYHVKFSLGVPLAGKLIVYTGKLVSESEMENKVEVPVNSEGAFVYSVTPSKTGKVVIPFLYSFEPAESDTININGMVAKHTFYVIDGREI